MTPARTHFGANLGRAGDALAEAGMAHKPCAYPSANLGRTFSAFEGRWPAFHRGNTLCARLGALPLSGARRRDLGFGFWRVGFSEPALIPKKAFDDFFSSDFSRISSETTFRAVSEAMASEMRRSNIIPLKAVQRAAAIGNLDQPNHRDLSSQAQGSKPVAAVIVSSVPDMRRAPFFKGGRCLADVTQSGSVVETVEHSSHCAILAHLWAVVN